MPDRYQTLFGASRPALDPALAGPEWVQEGIFLRNTKTGERRLKEIPGGQRATTAVPVPDTSLPAIAKEALGLAGATAADVNVGTARLPSLVLKATADTLKRGAGNLDPKGQQKKSERADAYMQLFGNPSMAEAIQDSHEARLLKFDPLAPAAAVTAGMTERARERLAEATQDLPTPVAVGVHQAATMAGMLADPTLAAGGKAPRALSEAAQEAAIAAGRRPGLGARAEAALQKGYGKLQDLDEADALLRDNLNRYPGYRKAYYEDRLDEVELGLQRLREADDAAPIPPYLGGPGDALQARPATPAGAPYDGFPSTGPVRKARSHAPQPLPELTGHPVTPVQRLAIVDAWATVSSRYPRISSSIRELRIDPAEGGAAYGDGIITANDRTMANPGALKHELTHAAQDLRGMLPRITDDSLDQTLRNEIPAYRRWGTGADLEVRLPAPPEVDLRAMVNSMSDPELARTIRSLEVVDDLDRRGKSLYSSALQELNKRSTSYSAQKAIEESDLPTGIVRLADDSSSLIDRTLRSAPPGPEAQGGIIASRGPQGGGAGASPPFRGQVAAQDQAVETSRLRTEAPPPFMDDVVGDLARQVEPPSLRGPSPSPELSVASPPLGPRPGSGEAGFIRLRPDPLPPADAAAKEAAWQMRKEYAATERLGRYRAGARAEELQKLIPKETDEALTWMFHELGDPRAYANRPAEVAARIAKKPGARRRVVEQIFADPNAESALQEVASWREQTRQMWDDLSDMWDLGFVKNYMHMTYEPPKGIGPKDSFRRLSATPSMTRSRTFMNPAEAMAAGYTPRTLRFSQLRAETEKVFAHAQAIRSLVDDLGKMPLLQDGRPPLVYATAGKQPQKYVHVPEWARPVFDAAARRSTTSNRALPEAVAHAGALQDESRRAAETAAGYFRYNPEGHAVPSVLEQPLLPGTEGLGPRTFRPPRTPTTPEDLWVHPEIWKELRPVLDHAEPLAIDKFIAITKRIKFLGSIFHPFELGLSAAQSMGPIKGAKAWAQRGGGIPGIAQLAEKKQWATPFTREVEEKWVRAGLGIEAPSADMMTDAFSRALVDFEDVMKRFSGTPFARPAKGAELAGRGLRETAAYYDEAIWGMHKKVKVAAAEQWESQIREALNGDRGAMGVANRFLGKKTRERLAAMSEDEIREEISGAINNHFGGQVWELKRNALLSDPRFVKWARRIWISPDWNVSAVSSGLAPLSGDPVHRIIGRTYWTNIGALAAGFAMLNYALTAGSEKGPHFPWDNEEGHKMDLETPFRTKPTEHNTGRIIHYRVGKHAQELPHLIWGKPVAQQLKFLAGKTAPWVGAAAGLMGKSVTEFPSPYEELVRERERTGEVPGPVEDIASRLEPTAEMALPFSLQDAEDPGDVLRKLLISIPESKGMSTYKAENLFAQALYENDSPRQTEIIQILRQNGYDDEAIGFMIQGAKRKAKRRLRAGR